MKKIKVIILMALVLSLFSMNIFAADVKVGGHMKMLLYDSAAGIHGVTSTPTGSYASSYYSGMIFSELILYISAELSDIFSVEVSPKFSASSGATPKFGSHIGANKASSVTPKFDYMEKALAKVSLPLGFELSAGMMLPVFTLDYGHELFWEEQYNAAKFSANPKLAAWHDTGLELYNVFELWDVSLPVYLYALNGNSYVDVNSQPVVMMHIEPSWGILKVSGSIAFGRDESTTKPNTFHKWSAGTQIRWEGIELRGEYARGKWDNALGTKDALSESFYVKALYKPLDWLRLMYSHEVLFNNYAGVFSFAPGAGERYVTNIAGMQIFITKSSILEFQVDVADWRKSSGLERIIYTRPTLGLRVTF